MNREFYKTGTSIAAGLSVIGFILPWLSLPFFGGISGYEIPSLFNRIGSQGILYYIIYLIPIFSLYLLYCEYSGEKKLFTQSKIIIFAISIFLIYWSFSKWGGDVFSLARIGFWMTIGSGIALFVQAIKSKQNDETND